MKKASVLFLAGVLCMGVFPAWATGVEVTDYNWLQMPGVTPFAGNGDGPIQFTGVNGSGAPLSALRWGNYTWAPPRTLTNNGLDTYWAGVQLDQPRTITAVRIQLFCDGSSGHTASHVYIEASRDGTNWILLEEKTFDPAVSIGRPAAVLVPVPTAKQDDYLYVRVRFDPTDGGYTAGPTGYGGPGLILVEPIGNGTLSLGQQVNWANASFGTSVSHRLSSDTWGTSNSWNSGSFEYNVNRVGQTTSMMPTVIDEEDGSVTFGDYLQIYLGEEARTINSILALCHDQYVPTSYKVWVSLTGEDGSFAPVTLINNTPPDNTGAMGAGALGYRFDEPVEARYVRITDATKSDHWGFKQVLVYGEVIPEPATMSLLGLGALALLRRRR